MYNINGIKNIKDHLDYLKNGRNFNYSEYNADFINNIKEAFQVIEII